MGNESQKSNAAAKQSSILSDFTDIPNDASTEELLQRTRTQLRVVNALTRGFLNVFLADLDTETLSVLKLEGIRNHRPEQKRVARPLLVQPAH